MAAILPIQSIHSPTAATAFPLQNLLLPTADLSHWETDYPSTRCDVVLTLSSFAFIDTVQLITTSAPNVTVTHVEVRALTHDVISDDLPVQHETIVLVPRTEICSAMAYKTASSSSACQTLRLPCAKTLKSFREIILIVAGLWEPTKKLGLSAVQLEGRIVPMVTTSSPPLVRPLPAVPMKVPPKVKQEAKDTTVVVPSSPTPAAISHYTATPTVKDIAAAAAAAAPLSSTSLLLAKRQRETEDEPPARVAPDPPLPAVVAAAPPPPPPLSGCIVVLSGFQNPLRSQLRDKVIALGGTCVADWGPCCTHLIAVANNTPKAYEARKSGHGVVVGVGWLLDAERDKKRHREADYQLGATTSAATVL